MYKMHDAPKKDIPISALARRTIGYIRYGDDMKQRVSLSIWVIINYLWWQLRRYPTLGKNLQNVKDTLIKAVTIRINGIKYSLVDSESLFLVSPEYEDWMWSYLRPKEGDVFIDVGAHVGKYTLQVASMVGAKGLVIAVEPHPENFQSLLRGVRLNGFRNVIMLNIAGWERDSKLKLFISEKAGWHSVKRNIGLGYIEVKARALDQILEKFDIKHVDWIKIDVEGAEFEVLKGLKDTLKKHRPQVIVEASIGREAIAQEFMENLKYTVTSIGNLDPTQWGVTYFYCKPST